MERADTFFASKSQKQTCSVFRSNSRIVTIDLSGIRRCKCDIFIHALINISTEYHTIYVNLNFPEY